MHIEDTQRCHANRKKTMAMDEKTYKSMIAKLDYKVLLCLLC
jgi:hypothetical protein